MGVPSGRQAVRRGGVLALAAAAVIFGHLQGWALAPAEPTAADTSPRRVDPATTVIDPWAEPAKPARPLASERALTGNPLWAVPLSSLSVTRERPIFAPSRRPPPPAAIAAAYIAPVMLLPPKPPEPDHPLLTLLGTVVAGETEGIGIFINQINGSLVRLKTGEQHEGWILRAVRGREAMFEKNDQSATLVLPPRNGSEPAADLRAPAAVGGAPIGAVTWMDGDGRMIAPPPTRAALPAAATTIAAPKEGTAK